MVWGRAGDPARAIPPSKLPFPTYALRHTSWHVGGKMETAHMCSALNLPVKGGGGENWGEGERHRRHQGAVILPKDRLPGNQRAEKGIT